MGVGGGYFNGQLADRIIIRQTAKGSCLTIERKPIRQGRAIQKFCTVG